MEFALLYFESLESSNHLIHEVCHHMPARPVRGKDIVFSERSCCNKIGRALYKLLRLIYISVIYYYVPFFTILL